jgi:hypothetical protein
VFDIRQPKVQTVENRKENKIGQGLRRETLLTGESHGIGRRRTL